MSITPRRRAVLCLLASAVAIYSSATISMGGGESAAERTAAAAVPKLTAYIYGARHCAACHDQEKGKTMQDAEVNKLICRMIEFREFNTKDKHQIAYQALTGERARKMSVLLKGDVSNNAACLACHSSSDSDRPTQLYARADDGVTCVACHGPVAEWVEIHQRTGDSAWRDLGRRDKLVRYGMVDLWDAERRAETCASCHIGNHSQGKVVTHAMYAAGHPPLPSFEAASFGDLEPRHWETFAEKSRDRKERAAKAGTTENLEHTQLVVTGGLVAFRESIRLIADEAKGNAGIDFARFDCAACHHDLTAAKGASPRQVRRRGGAPGRPVAPDWPLVLIRLATESADARKAGGQVALVTKQLEAFQQSLSSRPFGDPKQVEQAAREVVDSIDSIIQSPQSHVEAEMTPHLLRKLCKIATQSDPDYDSARQIAWAFRVIYHESVPVPNRDSDIERDLTQLTADLALDLPPTREQKQIESSLKERLRIAAAFDPKPFREAFKRIADRLDATVPVHEVSR